MPDSASLLSGAGPPLPSLVGTRESLKTSAIRRTSSARTLSPYSCLKASGGALCDHHSLLAQTSPRAGPLPRPQWKKLVRTAGTERLLEGGGWSWPGNP
ncbi:uncharacterized protein LOC108589582 isoform X2 [Callithrix jacchus]